MLEKMEVGKDTKECFTKMSKYRKMQDGLGSQMMQLDSPELQKSIEELKHRNCKTHSMKSWNTTVSSVPSKGQSSPSPARHWITA